MLISSGIARILPLGGQNPFSEHQQKHSTTKMAKMMEEEGQGPLATPLTRHYWKRPTIKITSIEMLGSVSKCFIFLNIQISVYTKMSFPKGCFWHHGHEMSKSIYVLSKETPNNLRTSCINGQQLVWCQFHLSCDHNMIMMTKGL